ncbi:hypothetical protein B4U80_05966 [Leptotrombidium deliense]|uniref:Peptidase S8/S53 domain-containing protein n=1 Tax=Leptotrombidium deliense TaxID=299467 RepID=A0A443S0I3_9ACAR|nr:hypothetical protein B4U80_05966 [Leptotrombidium deliense]
MKQVVNVQNDGIMRIMEVNEENEECITQSDGEWCLSRVSDARIENLDNYIHSPNAGANTTIYVVVAGILWTGAQDVKGIVSISLGGSQNQLINLAVYLTYNNGQFLAVAAGNEKRSACSSSPASARGAFTVAASNYTNELASFTNFGNCVDIISPGTKCLLANSTTGGFSHASGTSMATPLVAGVAAILLGKNSSLTPDQMTELLINVFMNLLFTVS